MFLLHKETLEHNEYELHNIGYALHPRYCPFKRKELFAISFDSSTLHMNMHQSNAVRITLFIEILRITWLL